VKKLDWNNFTLLEFYVTAMNRDNLSGCLLGDIVKKTQNEE